MFLRATTRRKDGKPHTHYSRVKSERWWRGSAPLAGRTLRAWVDAARSCALVLAGMMTGWCGGRGGRGAAILTLDDRTGAQRVHDTFRNDSPCQLSFGSHRLRLESIGIDNLSIDARAGPSSSIRRAMISS